MSRPLDVAVLEEAALDSAIPDLARLLVDAVDSGASVSFLAGLDQATAEAWWRGRAAAVGTGTLVPFVARVDARLAGCVLLALVSSPNGRHRAEIQKLLVHREARRQGVASALMARAEKVALGLGRWLLILDTETGSAAEGLYRRRGWQVAGVIPRFAVAPGGDLRATTFLWKDLRTQAERIGRSTHEATA